MNLNHLVPSWFMIKLNKCQLLLLLLEPISIWYLTQSKYAINASFLLLVQSTLNKRMHAGDSSRTQSTENGTVDQYHPLKSYLV